MQHLDESAFTSTTSLLNALNDRILVLDGSMGVMIQHLNLNENEFRGELLATHPTPLKGNNDILVLTRPEAIAQIHRSYLEAGADIIETNSFNANAISQREYGTSHLVHDINLAASRLARREADRFTALDGKPRFVAGSVGPTGMAASLSSDVNDPSSRDITFNQLKEAFAEQMSALIDGGVDLLLIETIFDALNAKAAIAGASDAMMQSRRNVPLILSFTLSDASGRLLSGHAIESILTLAAHAKPLAIGFNCSAGPEGLLPHLRRLSSLSPFATIVFPNAGLPDLSGNYTATPQLFASAMKQMLDERLANIVGGCCGTTPDHIRLLAETVKATAQSPRTAADSREMPWLAGFDGFSDKMGFINVGERCNVAGSRKFLRLVKEGKWDEALEIARKQVADGAMVIDINMDDALLDTPALMVKFLRLLGSDPVTASIPWMIDSSDFTVIEQALQNVAGKAIVNSISLKKGEEEFLNEARTIARYGAAVVVMAFDEQGQAATADRKIEICSRAYRLLTEKAGFDPRDIIFDPNVLTVATGMPEHDSYAADYIQAVDWISRNLPGAKTSGGISNLSFSFRGNNYIRQALHAVFLYHAINAGLSMAIMDPAAKVTYDAIPPRLLKALDDVVLNRDAEASARLIAMAAEYTADSSNGQTAATDTNAATAAARPESVDERLQTALRNGDDTHLVDDLTEALSQGKSANDIVEGPLTQGMEIVGKLFEKGKMFLPQVVRSARVMHRAVEILRPHLEQQSNGKSKGLFLTATVKGDVHDIGKNIVDVVLRCNNFEVIDLGVQVDAATIVDAARRHKPDFIGLSGLISPSLNEMAVTAKALADAGINVPLFVGGAATSARHTALKIAPLYDGVVVRVGDAAQNPVIASRLLSAPEAEARRIRELQAEICTPTADTVPTATAINVSTSSSTTPTRRPHLDWEAEAKAGNIVAPTFVGAQTLPDIPVDEVIPYINWTYFFNCWRVHPDSREAATIKQDALNILSELRADRAVMKARVAFFGAHSTAAADRIVVNTPDGDITIPTPRQRPTESRNVSLSLADYIAPDGYDDHIGSFVVTIGEKIREILRLTVESGDDYRIILLKSVCDRLAEATSERLHFATRTRLWGYSPDEPEDFDSIRRMTYRGIRPAVGYPSLPDQMLMHTLARLVSPDQIGVQVTENGALNPSASVAGFYFASPHARYFSVD